MGLRVKLFDEDRAAALEFYVNKFLEEENVRLEDITPLTVYFKYRGDSSERGYCMALVYEELESPEDEGSEEATEDTEE